MSDFVALYLFISSSTKREGVKVDRQTEAQRGGWRKRDGEGGKGGGGGGAGGGGGGRREREREHSNSKTLILKDSSFRSV